MKKLLALLLAVAMLCSCQTADKPSDQQSADDSAQTKPSPNVTDAPPTSEPIESADTDDVVEPIAEKLTGTRTLDLKQFCEEPDDRPSWASSCGGNTIKVSYYGVGVEKEYIRIIDISTNEVLSTIDVPEGYHTHSRGRYIDFEEDRGDGNNDVQWEPDYKRIMINPDDGSYEWVEGELNYSVIRFGSHGVYEDYGSICDADTKSPIIERYTEEGDTYGVNTLNYRFMFPLDDDRFVYRVSGYEQMPGFGIYDFTTGKATDIPDTRDMMPLGFCGGKILSYEASWDGYGTKLFVTDPESLETVLFSEPFENVVPNDYVDFTMSEDMKYVCASLIGENSIRCLIMNPETAETVSDFTLESHYYRPFFTDDYLFFEDPTAAKLCMITDRT